MVTRDLPCEELCLTLNILLHRDKQLLQLVLGLERMRLELLALLGLDLVVIHRLVDHPQIITQLFLVMKLLVYPFDTLLQPYEIIYIVNLLSQNLRLVTQPGIQLICVLLHVLW